MRCSGCSAEAWVGGTGSLLNGECHVCAVSRAEKAEERVKELELDVMNREGYIETLESIIAKTQLQINGITINRKRK